MFTTTTTPTPQPISLTSDQLQEIKAQCEALAKLPSFELLSQAHIASSSMRFVREQDLDALSRIFSPEEVYKSIFTLTAIEQNGDLTQIAHQSEEIIASLQQYIDTERATSGAATIIRNFLAKREQKENQPVEGATVQEGAPVKPLMQVLEEAGIDRKTILFLRVIESHALPESNPAQYIMEAVTQKQTSSLMLASHFRKTLGDDAVDLVRDFSGRQFSERDRARVLELEAANA